MKMKLKNTIWLSVLPLFPVILLIGYIPIDSLYTVDKLGCGCHPWFNANNFNHLILCPIIIAASGIALLFGSRVINGKIRWIYFTLGFAFQILVGWVFWQGSMWA